jgi:hypothetical protein
MGEAEFQQCSVIDCTKIIPTIFRSKQFKLTDIPGVMDRLKWPTAARLMRHWFAGTPYIKNSTKGSPRVLEDLDIEALSTSAERLRNALKEIQEALANVNEYSGIVGQVKGWFERLSPGLIVLMARLERLGALSFAGKTVADRVFGYSGRKGSELDELTQFNRVALGATWIERAKDPLDDLYGAFGAFTVKMAALDMTTHSSHLGYPAIQIRSVGLYLHDSYDFVNDGAKDQRLGHWGEHGVLKRMSNDEYIDDDDGRYFRVSNKSFNRYRAKWGRGGDFMVYSTVREIPVDIMVHLNSIDFDEAKARKSEYGM